MASPLFRRNAVPWPFIGARPYGICITVLPHRQLFANADLWWIALPFKHFRVMNVIAAVLTAKGDHTKMKHFTIDNENNIAVHASKKAARETGAGVFSTEEQFADLIGPDNKRLVDIWNSLPGVKPVTKFANRKVATERIWKAIQSLGGAEPVPAPVAREEEPVAATPESSPALEAASEPTTDQPTTPTPNDSPLPEEASEPATAQFVPALIADACATVEPVADAGAQAPNVAPTEAPAPKKATAAKNAPKAKRAPRRRKAPGRARAARRPRWSPCSSARTAPRWRRSWKRWGGRSTPFAASWPAR